MMPIDEKSTSAETVKRNMSDAPNTEEEHSFQMDLWWSIYMSSLAGGETNSKQQNSTDCKGVSQIKVDLDLNLYFVLPKSLWKVHPLFCPGVIKGFSKIKISGFIIKALAICNFASESLINGALYLILIFLWLWNRSVSEVTCSSSNTS